MKKFLKNFLLFLKLNRFSIFISLILAILWETQMIKFHWIWIFCPFWIPLLLVAFAIIICYIDIIFTGLSISNIKTTFILVKNFHEKLIQMLKQKLKDSWIWK